MVGEEVDMVGKVSPEIPGEWVGSSQSASVSPEEALDDTSGSATAVDATSMRTSSAPASRCSSPLASVKQPVHFRSNSFHRWKRQVQRAWRWGPAVDLSVGKREQSLKTTLNLEIMAKQKRLWYQTKSKIRDIKQYTEPTSLFEQIFIVGLQSHANVEATVDAFAKRKDWYFEASKSDILHHKKIQYNGQMPTFEPQVLFKYPPVKRVAMKESDIPSFCFPEGVKARLLERTPSMSDLNELVFGQEHLGRDDLSFIFCLKVSDNSTLYGVCLHVEEIVQRAPGILGAVSPLAPSSCKPSRFLVAAPRCYCILTRVPFFELHYEMLNSIILQERLNRITEYINDMALLEQVPPALGEHETVYGNCHYPGRESCDSWMGFVIQIDSVAGLTSSSVVTTSDREAAPNLFRPLGCHSPESASFSEASDNSHLRELDKESRKSWQCLDDFNSEISGYRSDSFERVNGVFENGQVSPEANSTNYHLISYPIEHVGSLESIYSSVRCLGSEDGDDNFSLKLESVAGDEKVIEWAKENNNEPLQIVCGYHALQIPSYGGEIVFQPLEHLQPIKYCRPDASSLGLDYNHEIDTTGYPEVNWLKSRLAAAEEAFSISMWSVATICRALSLESVLAFLAGALLEKQVVVICPNLGILSAIVLSIIPIIQPFEWQSLFLPVLPGKMLDFLDAPVPYIMGIQHKPPDMKLKASSLMRVNVCKNKVKSCPLPQLPSYRKLVSELTPVHARLKCEDSIAKRHPVYKCSEAQAEAAGNFLHILRHLMESLCSNLRSHTITNIEENSNKVSLLLKDSFIDSFPVKDRPFMKLFVDTQLFSVLSDSRMSSFENEKA